MTGPYVIRFCEQRPFVPITMCLVDGRDYEIPHSDFVATGNHSATIIVYHRSGQVEVIDAALIVSLQTTNPHDRELLE